MKKEHRRHIYIPKDDIPDELVEMTRKARDTSIDMTERIEVAMKLLTCAMLIDNAIWEFEDTYLPFVEENEELVKVLRSLVYQ